MLVLSRKENEVLRIGSDIEIMVVGIKGDRVKLGIKAPASIPVHRQEVYEKITAEGRIHRRDPDEND